MHLKTGVRTTSMAWNGTELDSIAIFELALHLEGKLGFLGVQHSNGVWKTAWHY